MTMQELKEKLLANIHDGETDYAEDRWWKVNDKTWTVPDLFIRQYLNNGCNGFGMKKVSEMYDFLVENRQFLIDNDLVNKEGYNNSGFPLWGNYDF